MGFLTTLQHVSFLVFPAFPTYSRYISAPKFQFLNSQSFTLALWIMSSTNAPFYSLRKDIHNSRWKWAVDNILSRHQSYRYLPAPAVPDLFVCSNQCCYACFCPCDVHERIVGVIVGSNLAQDSCFCYATLCMVCSPFVAAGCNFEHGVQLRRKLGVPPNHDLWIQHCVCPCFALAQELRAIETMPLQRAPLRQRMS